VNTERGKNLLSLMMEADEWRLVRRPLALQPKNAPTVERRAQGQHLRHMFLLHDERCNGTSWE
jgi:hypothetical protein